MNKFDISNLDLYYGQLHALKNVELQIPARQITAFIGPSGCGKTTVGRTMLHLYTPTEGEVWFGGKKIEKGPVLKEYRRKAQLVFQDP